MRTLILALCLTSSLASAGKLKESFKKLGHDVKADSKEIAKSTGDGAKDLAQKAKARGKKIKQKVKEAFE